MAKLQDPLPSFAQDINEGQSLPSFRPQELSDEQVAGELDQMTQVLTASDQLTHRVEPGKIGQLRDFMNSAFLTRAAEVREPTPSFPELGGLTAEQTTRAQSYEAQRLRSEMSLTNEATRKAMFMRRLAEEEPEVAERLWPGGVDGYLEEIIETGFKASSGGWRAIDGVLRNLDRGRGAAAAYFHARAQGASVDTALAKGKDILLGSEHGFKWVPEQLGPGWKEVLKEIGFEDSRSTGVAGFGLDVLLDPINAVSIGAARGAKVLTSGQILNETGMATRAKLLRRYQDELAATKGVQARDLEVDELRAAWARADGAMRELINSSRDVAKQMMDFGGLKIAGVALPLTQKRLVAKQSQILKSGAKFRADLVPQNVVRGVVGSVAHATERGGQRLRENELAPRLGLLMEHLPAHLRQLGERVGMLVNRTNPAAGREYKVFKQAELYDRLGLSTFTTAENYRRVFQGLRHTDLMKASHAIERGEVDQFLAVLQQEGRDAQYVQKMAGAIDFYRREMDDMVIDEVKRGFFDHAWPDGKRQLFEQWVRSGRQLQLDDKLLGDFQKFYVDNYVPHWYQNSAKAKALRGSPSRPRGVSIVEPHTYKRLPNIKTLDDAIDAGLVPETNLAKLYAIRRNHWDRARITHDFLEQTAESWGIKVKDLTDKAPEVMRLANTPQSVAIWQKLNDMPRNRRGKAAIDVSEQVEMARGMAFERRVPLETVGLLEDDAIREFLKMRLQVSTPSKAAYVWREYVEKAAKSGTYDGFKLAPARSLHESVAIAKDLHDPAYVQWRQFTAGGIADPHKLANVYLPDPIVRDLENLKRRILDPEFTNLIRGWDKLQNFWKRSVTIPFPAFHVRNQLTNLLNGSLEIGLGVITERPLLYDLMTGKDGYILTDNGTQVSYRAIRQAARRFGVVRAVYKRHDARDLVEGLAVTESKWPTVRMASKHAVHFPGYKEMLRRGELLGSGQMRLPITLEAAADVGSLIENSDRLVLFTRSLKRGMSFEQASERVNRFLFDYDDISVIERDVVRRLFAPFWTWTRKNLELQLKEALRSPVRFTHPYKFARALSEEKDDALKSDLERNLLPEHLSDTYGLRLDASRKMSKWLLNFDVPQETLNLLWSGSKRKTMLAWLGQMGPFATGLFEELAQHDVFFDRAKKHKPYLAVPGGAAEEFIKAMPQELKNFVGARPRKLRDREYWEVKRGPFMTLTWLSGWSLTRAWSTVGSMTDPRKGNVAERMFNVLTGMRVEHVNPEQELRSLIYYALQRSDGKGIVSRLRQEHRIARDAMRFVNDLRDEEDKTARGLSSRLEDPEHAMELDDQWLGADEDGTIAQMF